MDWRELVELIKAGNPSAGTWLVSALSPTLERFASIRAPDLGQADQEAAVDNALTNVVKKIDKYDPTKASLPTWARAFVMNELNELRRSKREDPTDPGLLPTTVSNQAAAPTDEVRRRDIALMALVLQQGADAALLVELHVVDKLTFEQIAEQLGPPANAPALRKQYQRIKTRIYNAAKTDPDLREMTEEAT